MMAVATETVRETAYGQDFAPSIVDRFGVWLGAREVDRHVDFRGVRLADLGCGFDATLTRTKLDTVASALLVDVALAPDLGVYSHVTALEAPLEEALPQLPDQAFDVVLVLSVLEHLRHPQDALVHVRRILAPGGVTVINVPTWLGKRFLEFAAFRLGVSRAEEMDDHKAYYDPRDLWPMLVKAGFRPGCIRCARHKFGLNTSAVCRVPGATA